MPKQAISRNQHSRCFLRIDHLEDRLAPAVIAPIRVRDDHYTTATYTPLSVGKGGVLRNDSRGLQVTDYTPQSTFGASVVVLPNGHFQYDPMSSEALQALAPNTVQKDSFQYTVTSKTGQTNVATVNITFKAPSLVSDWLNRTVKQNEVLQINAAEGLLANDRLPANVTVLQVQKFSRTSKMGAKVSVNPDGSYSYDPTAARKLLTLTDGQIAVDSFDYWVRGVGKSTAYINVAGVPNGAEDVGATAANAVLNVPANGLLANDPGSNPKVIAFDKVSKFGATVQVNADGSYVYTPTDAVPLRELAEGEVVYDTFTYTSLAGRTRTKTTVTIQVTGVNETPVANDDHAEAAVNKGLESTTSVLSNDLDIDEDDSGSPLTITESDLTSILGATVRVREDGTFVYDPSTSLLLADLVRDEVAEDSFTYTVVDHHGATAVGTVRVNVRGVEHAVAAINDNYTSTADDVLVVPVDTGLLANDSDRDSNDTLAVVEFDRTSAQGAKINVASDGSFVYDPSHSEPLYELQLGQQLTDTFNYIVSDGHGSIVTATATVVVHGATHGVNDSFVALPTEPYVGEAPGLFYNDDLATPSLYGHDATSTLGATITINADGSFTYDPTAIPANVLDAAIAASADPNVVYDYFSYQSTDTGTGSIVMAHVAVALDIAGTLGGTAGRDANRNPPPITMNYSQNTLTITVDYVPSNRYGVRVEVAPMRNDGSYDVTYETWVNTGYGRVWQDFAFLGTYNFFAGAYNITFNGSSRDDIFVVDWQTNFTVKAYGNGGDDVLIGGGGISTLDGGAGNDQLFAQSSNDLLIGGDGADKLLGWNGNDTLVGGDGPDILDGGYGDDILEGNSGADSYIGGPGATMAIMPNRSEGDEWNPSPGDRINPQSGDLIVGLKSQRQTDRDLNAQAGTLVASLNDDGSTLTLNGPGLYGFKFTGSAGAFKVNALSGGGEEFVATSTVMMSTAVGNLPIPATSLIPFTVRTSSDPFARAGSVTSIGLKNLLSLKTSNPDDPLAQFKSDFGLSFAPSGLSLDFGLKLGKDLDGLGVNAPLNPSIPYFFFKSGAASLPTLSLGENSISGGVSGGIYLAFDPSDPFLFLKTVIPNSPLSEIAFAGSIKGQIPFVARQTPSVFSGNGPILFREATATFSQAGYNVSSTIDKIESGYNGWAVFGQANVQQSAVFQPTIPLTTDQVTFDLVFNSPYREAKIQKLRLLYTTDANPTATSSTNWLPLTPATAKHRAGNATINGDGTVSFAYVNSSDTYQITVDGPFDAVTGFRLEAIPVNGKLSYHSNGNFVLSEFKATSVRQEENVNAPQLYGNIYGDAKLNIDKFQVSLEGSFVIDLDANNDGSVLGLSGNELSQLFKGKTSLDTVLGNILSDVRMGANARVNAEIGLGSSGLALTVPLASATALVRNNAIGIKGATAQPFEGTPLSFIQAPSVSAEGYFTGNRDFGFAFKMTEAKIGGISLGGTAASLEVNNHGAKFEASYRLPIINVQASIVGSINSQGLFEFIASAGASFNAGPLTLSGSLTFRFANFNTPGVPLNGVTLGAHLRIEGGLSLPWPLPDPFIRVRGDAKFTVTKSGLSIAGSGRVEGGAGSLVLGVSFSFSNSGFSVDLPWPVPDISVRF